MKRPWRWRAFVEGAGGCWAAYPQAGSCFGGMLRLGADLAQDVGQGDLHAWVGGGKGSPRIQRAQHDDAIA